MSDLPLATSETRDELLAWLENFSNFVRSVDYAAARPLFHPDVLAFGTHRDVISGIDQWMKAQWDNVWPRTDGFSFNLEQTQILASDDKSTAIAIAPWTSIGFHEDGTKFDRPGRATMIFHRQNRTWICTHSHMSLNRGVPQTSHGDRPVHVG